MSSLWKRFKSFKLGDGRFFWAGTLPDVENSFSDDWDKVLLFLEQTKHVFNCYNSKTVELPNELTD